MIWLVVGLAEFGSDKTSFLQKCLPPVKAVVWSVREGEDGRVH